MTVKLWTTGATVEEIVTDFCRWRGIADGDRFLRLLALSESAIEEGFYIREFAARPVYFRRVRVPPLVWVFWNNVTTGGLVGKLYRHLVRDQAAAVAEGHRAVETVRAMRVWRARSGCRMRISASSSQPSKILAHLREVLLGLETPQTRTRLADLLAAYRRRYPDGYRFDYPPTAQGQLGPGAALLIQLLIRDRMQYRAGDRLLLDRGRSPA